MLPAGSVDDALSLGKEFGHGRDTWGLERGSQAGDFSMGLRDKGERFHDEAPLRWVNKSWDRPRAGCYPVLGIFIAEHDTQGKDRMKGRMYWRYLCRQCLGVFDRNEPVEQVNRVCEKCVLLDKDSDNAYNNPQDERSSQEGRTNGTETDCTDTDHHPIAQVFF